jgi:hypothetical protein
MGGFPPWGLGTGLTTPHRKKPVSYIMFHRASELVPWNDLCIWLRIGPATGSCEHGNEPPVFIKGGVFLDYLSDY